MIAGHNRLHLSYCTNIHPSSGLAAVRDNLERYTVPVKARLSPEAPFGVGLRLSAAEAQELMVPGALEAFRIFLDQRGLYVFTMNGFPYGAFHGQPVKAQVHAPDWRSEERVQYTLHLARILAGLLPSGVNGGISTSPLSYRGWVAPDDEGAWEVMTSNIVRVVEALARMHEQQGVLIHLDVEPEPDGLLECTGDLVGFFQERLLQGGARELAQRLGESVEAARARMATHVQVCFDTCHAAVMYESPAEALRKYEAAGMRIGKVQVSSALRVDLTGPDRQKAIDALHVYDESTYLHQVVQRSHDGRLVSFRDLNDALATAPDAGACEWRVHFHVPLFWDGPGPLRSTREAILETFGVLRERPFTQHLEVETYTWDVLPPDLKVSLSDSIERELRWVQRVL
ncbi:sugar phosphate isomerase [Deinococcus malanensis]|uniref:Sugar phosphate isomerase n=1 Tax=Deinococcus malanensis TaxID=1706855 RepID=A0ABQ2F068_9DEIO|nr:metabolite traffic protein EboE [Deinococcus malanensis]GGK33824.1 sugar phosphate isomerase [Deinococcus malanensis]